MGTVATVVLWIAAATRIIVTIRRPDPARICMTLGAVCVASAFTLAVSANWFDATVNWPNGAELLQHLLFAAAAYLIFLFMVILRVGVLDRRTLVRQSVIFSIASLTMIGLFAIAPVHEQPSTDFAREYGSDLAAVLYRLVFYVYLTCCLVLVARTSLKHGFTRGDWPRTVSLIGIGTGAAAAAIAATAGAAQMLTLLAGNDLPILRPINTVAIGLAGTLAGIGVLVPIPVDALLRWRRARTTRRSIEPLWAGLTKAVPEVVLAVQPTTSPLVQAELATTRRRIEIADALSRIRVDARRAAAIRASDDPPVALGRLLRDTSAWSASATDGVIAADMLHVRSAEDELQQILAIAGAYQEIS